jgi:hypothetical protein
MEVTSWASLTSSIRGMSVLFGATVHFGCPKFHPSGRHPGSE